MPLAEKGVRGKGREPLSPPQRWRNRSAKALLLQIEVVSLRSATRHAWFSPARGTFNFNLESNMVHGHK